MRVLICGSREWDSKVRIRERMRLLRRPDTLVITGGARGADKLAYECARELGLDRLEWPANWIGRGKPAGPVRNRQMLDLNPDLVIAFHENLMESKGTLDCVNEAIKRDIEVEVIVG